MPDGSLESGLAGSAGGARPGGGPESGGFGVASAVPGASDHRRHVVLAVLVVVLFLALNNVRLLLERFHGMGALYTAGRADEATVVWKAVQVLLVLLATMLLPALLGAAGAGAGGSRAWRVASPGAALRTLGLHDDALAGLAWAFVGTLPALLGFAWLGSLRPGTLSWALVMTAVASPIAEEVLYRGFLVRQLYQCARWPFWLAALANALPFALGHLYQVRDIGAGLPGAAGILVITGLGAAFAGWLFARWRWNLWPAIGFHAFMNLWAFMFMMGESVVSTPAAIPFMALAAVATAAVTIWRTGGWRIAREG
jgi:membrane protease YdiL (CAAX protease family)